MAQKDKKAKVEKVAQQKVNQLLVDSKTKAVNEEVFAKLLKGEITYAQAIGMTAEQAYEMAKLGQNLIESAQNEAAMKIFDGLIAFNPLDPYFHAVKGTLLARTSNLEGAVQSFTEAIDLGSTDTGIRANRAEIYLQLGRLEEAVQDLKVVLEAGKKEDASTQRATVLALATKQVMEEALAKKMVAPK